MQSLADERRRDLLNKFCDRVVEGRGLLPAPEPLPYDPVPAIETVAWPLGFVQLMVSGELSETTNLINQWLGSLRRWHAWNELLRLDDDDIRWGAEWEWVEPLAFQSMFQPSATRDRFIMIATNALHQVRLAIDPSVRDELLGDPAAPGEQRVYPSRLAKEKQLKQLAKPWAAGKVFIQALGQLDDRDYRQVTSDFRNRASHGIAPRFSAGITSMVTRTRVQATKSEEQPDGSYLVVPVPDKMATSYDFGGTEPLSMDEAWKANLKQFTRARRLFDAYVALLGEATAAMPQRRRDDASEGAANAKAHAAA